MEFKFRAVDDRPPPTFLSPPSTISYFTDQAFRAGLSSTSDHGPNRDATQNPNDAREAMERELEKERIREEIIVTEIARRRMLEAEVRRELMVEREMAMRRVATAEGLSFEERLAMRLDSRLHPFDAFAFPSITGAFHMFSTPRFPEAMPFDIKPPPPPEVNKDKLILLAKPDPNHSGTKRKAVTPPAMGASELPPFGLKKRPKEEWSCAICQVSATSEKGLNEHLQGKKHKAKEAGLRSQRTGKSSSTTPLPKKTTKPSKLTETPNVASSELEAKVEGESLQQSESGDGSDQKMEKTEDLKNNDERLPLQKKQIAKDSKKRNSTKTEQKAERTAEIKKKFKFWCEMCQCGAYSQVVMENHKNGKKHMARLQELSQDDGAVVATTTMASSETTRKAEDENVVAREDANVLETEANKPDVTQKTEGADVTEANKSDVTQKTEGADVTEANKSDVTQKAEDADVMAKEANKSDVSQKAEDADVMAKEANTKTTETVVADADK